MKRTAANLKNGSRHVAVLVEKTELASAWLGELRRVGFTILGESVLVKEEEGQILHFMLLE